MKAVAEHYERIDYTVYQPTTVLAVRMRSVQCTCRGFARPLAALLAQTSTCSAVLGSVRRPPDLINTMVNLQRFLYPRGWDVRLVRGVYAELLGTLLLSFIFNLTAVNSTNNAALAAGASYAVLGADSR